MLLLELKGMVKSGSVLVIMLYFYLVSSVLYAAEFSYKLTQSYKAPNLVDAYELNRDFKNLGFSVWDLSNAGQIPISQVEQVWTAPSNLAQGDSFVIYKQGLEPSRSKLVGQIVSLNGHYLFHGLSSSGEPYALYFVNFETQQVTSVLQKLGLLRSSVVSLFISTAVAAEVCDYQKSGNLNQIQDISRQTEVSAVQGMISSCFFSALRGAKETVTGTAEAVSGLISDPAAFWSQTLEKVKALKNFFAQIGPELSAIYQNLSDLDSQTKTDLTCTMVGSMAPVAAQRFLFAGGPLGLAQYGAEILTKLKSLTAVLRNMKLFKVKGAEDAVACAFR